MSLAKCVDLHDHKLTRARQYGATHTINAKTDDPEAKVQEILGGLADVTIDGTGSPRVIETAYDLARLRGGRCVLFGVLPKDKKVSIQTLPLHFGRTLTGSEGGQSRPHEDIPRILAQLAASGTVWRGFITHRGPLADVNDLMAKMRSGEVVHAIVDPARG
jgi:S-(hydroxymethyl)glutathione dehydrogenase/alcohol dehydrogenase